MFTSLKKIFFLPEYLIFATSDFIDYINKKFITPPKYVIAKGLHPILYFCKVTDWHYSEFEYKAIQYHLWSENQELILYKSNVHKKIRTHKQLFKIFRKSLKKELY